MNGGSRTGCSVPDAATLMALARSASGIDLPDDDAATALPHLVQALNNEGMLHAPGARAMRDYLVRILVNRLRMARDLRAHPVIREQPITAPVFLCGMARTGSTKLHKLLAASGDFNWAPFWLVLYPSLVSGDPGEPPHARIEAGDRFARWFDEASPLSRRVHWMTTHEPEEDAYLVEQSLMSYMFNGWAPVNSFMHWLSGQPPAAPYHHLRLVLQYLQWQGLADPRKPWVLKSPLHAGMEAHIRRAFPDCRFVMTHRHPAEAIPSCISLLQAFHAPYTTAPVSPLQTIANHRMTWCAQQAFRDTVPAGTVLDVPYQRLLTHWERQLQRVYDHLGLPLQPQALSRMQQWNGQNPQHKDGQHRYGLAEFGLDTAHIDAELADYLGFLSRLPDDA